MEIRAGGNRCTQVVPQQAFHQHGDQHALLGDAGGDQIFHHRGERGRLSAPRSGYRTGAADLDTAAAIACRGLALQLGFEPVEQAIDASDLGHIRHLNCFTTARQ